MESAQQMSTAAKKVVHGAMSSEKTLGLFRSFEATPLTLPVSRWLMRDFSISKTQATAVVKLDGIRNELRRKTGASLLGVLRTHRVPVCCIPWQLDSALREMYSGIP